MDEFDRGVRASIVAHDMFYGLGQAIGFGLSRRAASQAAIIADLQAENEGLRERLNALIQNAMQWEHYALTLEADRDHNHRLLRDVVAENEVAADRYDQLHHYNEELLRYAHALREQVRQEQSKPGAKGLVGRTC